jgi:hypothetical protein
MQCLVECNNSSNANMLVHCKQYHHDTIIAPDAANITLLYNTGHLRPCKSGIPCRLPGADSVLQDEVRLCYAGARYAVSMHNPHPMQLEFVDPPPLSATIKGQPQAAVRLQDQTCLAHTSAELEQVAPARV